MFRLKDGYFSKMECPTVGRGENCSVLNCVFQHNTRRKRAASDREEPETASDPKRQAIKDVSIILPKALATLAVPRNARAAAARKIAKYLATKLPTPNRAAIESEFEIAVSSRTPAEYETKVKVAIGEPLETHKDAATTADARFILPREIVAGAAPAPIQERKRFIQLIVEVYRQALPQLKTPIRTAIEDEYKIASTTTRNTYPQTIKRFVYDLRKDPQRKRQQGPPPLLEAELIASLAKLVIPREKLRQFGYIVDKPAAIATPAQVRTCKRCSLQFKLKEQLDANTKCLYHSGRNKKKDTLQREWTCCGGIVGVADCHPCCVLEHHVFQWDNPEEMHHAIPFTSTNDLPTSKTAFKAIGIDCEMGYTTMGFELLRTTAIDFISGEEIVDILVRPKGVVIDLNTKWLGVAEIKEEAVTFEDHLALLNEIMDKNTILVGHGLENDLNAMRILHNRVVDTAILYPKHKVTPQMRFLLKYLCFTYLGRTIQTGEHDSGEDSLGAIDVVKHFINKDREK